MRQVAFADLPVLLEGAIAQLGERVLCKHEVVGSIPSGSTRFGDSRQLPCPQISCSLVSSNIQFRFDMKLSSGSGDGEAGYLTS